MANSLYPGFILLFYTVSTLQHKAILPVLPYQGVGGAWFVQTVSSSIGVTWESAVNSYASVLRGAWNAATGSVDYAELWTYESLDGDPIFRASSALTLAGNGGQPATLMQQSVITFRTKNGGISKLYIMEQALAVNQVLSPPGFGGNTVLGGLSTLVLGSSGFVVGRDGSFPIAAIRARTKTNDALRRKRQLFS